MRLNKILFSFMFGAIVITEIGWGSVQAAAPACQPIGPQKGLVIAVNFPSNPGESKSISGIDADYFASSNSLQDYWDEVSYGQTTMTGDTLGWFTLDYPGWEECNIYDIRLNALEAASAFVDVTEYNRIFLRIVKPPECTISAAGQGSGCASIELPGGGNMEASTSWNYDDTNRVIFHEGGHNLGLPHASSEDYGSDIIGPVGVYGTFTQYGDLFDAMGSSDRTGHHNAMYKHRLGMITDADVIDVVTSGTHIIEPLTVAGTGKKAVRIFRGAAWQGASSVPPIRKEYLWVETRKDTGYDSNIRRSGDDADTVFGGALIHINHNYFAYSHLLDMHPGTASNEFQDAPLVSRETFIDPYAGITVDHDKVNNPDKSITLTVTIANPDSDEDGIPDISETSFGTNPNLEDMDGDTLTDFFEVCYDDDCNQYNPGVTDLDASTADTENDGMPDDYELANNLDPLVDDSAVDGDGDGLTNLQEFQVGTNPNLADTDADRLSDGDEVNVYGTDPLERLDTDEDGMSDDWENVRGTNAALNDARTDSDGDGVDNAIEYLRDTLPLDSNSIPTVAMIYVDPSNSNGDGSQQNPYGDLNAAILATQHGDTLILASGAYTVSPFYFQKSINIVGPADRSAVITSEFFAYYNVIWGDISGISLLLTYETNVFQTVRNVTFSNCRIELSGYLYLKLNYILWKNCTIVDPNNGTDSGLIFQAGGASQFINSTITGFTTGLRVVNGGPDLIVRNTILNNIDDLVDIPSTAGFQYNLISDGDLAGINGNITGTPQFVDAANGDYHLQADSIAIDAGKPSDIYTLEPENNGDRINMGAYGNTTEATAGNDNDGDGLSNQNEHCNDGDCASYNPYHPTTNPTGADTDINNSDTDGDGWSDNLEITYGSDPVDATSAPVDGDVSLDGQVNVADVLLAQRFILGLTSLTAEQIAHGDFRPGPGGDGQLTLPDMLIILQTALSVP